MIIRIRFYVGIDFRFIVKFGRFGVVFIVFKVIVGEDFFIFGIGEVVDYFLDFLVYVSLRF